MKRYSILFIALIALMASSLHAQHSEPMYVMKLTNNWEIQGDLPTQALLISLQGVANIGAPRLYFLYAQGWDYNFCEPILNYYKDKRSMQFTELATADDALGALKSHANGYIVWDTSARTSLIVAFTAAAVNQAVVVTEALIPMVEKHGLKPIEDFRGTFTGQSDYDIYQWAYKKYWNSCSKDFLIYMGGESGSMMKPGIADFGIYKKAFFTDASTDPSDSLEYLFARRLFREMKPLSLVMGWHSYAKDKEADHVRLASNYALRVEGLHTLPNMSFNNQIPLTPGYAFKNNHHVQAGAEYPPKKKVYISCIQSDCLGLGSWTKPGRGDIPYAWEVTMNWLWLAPAMLQFYYDMATPNDYFIGSLSGPGYMYPKSIPTEYMPDVVDSAYALMKALDLTIFELMEHTSYWESGGINDDVTKDVLEFYFKGMPDAIGFANGYRPAHTFAVQDGRPFISYDYYLSEKRDLNEAAADLMELANLNPRRPYFLLIHIRQWSDINRVKEWLKKLGSEFELIPLDLFMKMAGVAPTFKTRYAEE
ncbi:MAG: GxGYxYP domain-containing protein [Candidatus Zhuqueibacterota bacterium]